MKAASFSKNAIIYLIGGIVAAGGNFILAPFYLRILSSDQYGIWSQFMLMLQFLQPILSWGILATMTRVLSEVKSETKKIKITTSLKLITGLNLIVLIFVAMAYQLSFIEKLFSENLFDYFLIAILISILAAYPSMLSGIYVADGAALKYRGLNLFGFILQGSVLYLCVLALKINAKIAILAYFGSVALYSAFALYKLFKKTNWNNGQPNYKEVLNFGIPIMLYTITGQAADVTIRYMLSLSTTLRDFGEFSALLIYASLIAMLASAINLAWIPIFYQNGKEWLESGFYHKITDIFTVFTGIFSLLLVIFFNELYHLYSGSMPTLNTAIIAILAAAAWLNSSVWMAISNPLFFYKKTKTIFFTTFISLLISIVLGFILVRESGALGAAIVILINSIILCIIAGLISLKHRISIFHPYKVFLVLISLYIFSIPSVNEWLNGSIVVINIAKKAFIFSTLSCLLLATIYKSVIKIKNSKVL